MNYEFHVGDYVEDIDGRVGYISKICHCDKCKERGWFEPHIVFSDGEEDYISDCDIKCISNIFTRIGAYDFTKEEKKKIESLDYNAIYTNYIDKINELVDAVNELRDKEDK